MAFGSRAELRCGLLHSGMLLSALLLSGVLGCGGGPDAPADEPPTVVPRVAPAPAGDPWQTLGEWHLFTDAVQQAPNERVVPYDVIAPLYSDYTFKRRFVFIPEGTAIEYDPTAVWQLPVGTILVKTFSYLTDMRDPSLGERLLEKPLLLSWITEVNGRRFPA